MLIFTALSFFCWSSQNVDICSLFEDIFHEAKFVEQVVNARYAKSSFIAVYPPVWKIFHTFLFFLLFSDSAPK